MPITKHPRTGRYVAGADRLSKATMSDPADECGPKKRKKLMDGTVQARAKRADRPRNINR